MRIKCGLLGMLCALLLIEALPAATPLPKPSLGRVERFADFASSYVPARHIDVWLPPGYSDKSKYAVLYMHDGQMLFDAGITWNKQEWRADETAAELMQAGKTRPFVIVAVHNAGPRRHSEYFPQKPFEALPAALQGELLKSERSARQSLFSGPVDSDAYLKFLVHELKPFIDRTYSVKTDAANTVIMGSSMGGLISWYALAEYPEVFGAAGCLSTHWPGVVPSADNPVPAAFFAYLKTALPEPGGHRLYFDYGTATLDAAYPDLQKQADALLWQRGYGPQNWQTLRFEGAEHSEKAWSARLAIPLQFLLAPES
jgi:Putative esterase